MNIATMAVFQLHAVTHMTESKRSVATGSTVEELVPDRGATTVAWKWFGYCCNERVIDKFSSPSQAEAPS